MKHFNKYYLIVLGLSLLPLVSIFTTSQMPHVHDGVVHLARMAAYFKALQDFQIPVRWAGDLNYGYGMPLFNFIYHVPYVLSSLFLFLGFGLVDSFKMVLTLSFLLSGVFMFAFAKAFFNPSADGDRKALLLAVFYQFAPFRLVEIMVRGSFGEVYAYTFFPLVLFGLVKIFKKRESFWVIVVAVATALLVLSHNALSLTFFGISVLLILFFAKTKKNILLGATGLLIGISLSAFYWIPAILEHKYTYGDLFMKDLFRSHFPPIQNFFIPNFTNTATLQTGGISVQIGLFHSVALLLSIIILLSVHKLNNRHSGDPDLSGDSRISYRGWRFWTSQNDGRMILFCLLLFLAAIFFMSSSSLFIWERVSFLRQFQFSWRFLGIVAFATSLLSINFLSFKLFTQKWVFMTLIFFVVASTAYYWRPPLGFDKIDEKYYWNYPLNTTYFGETDVIWSAGAATSYPKKRVEVIGGKAKIVDFKKKSNKHTFIIDAQTDSQIVDHTQYFHGWRVNVDGKFTPIEFQDPNNRGEITFRVPKGRHDVKVEFGETKVRLFADFASMVTLLGLLVLFALRYRFAK